MPRYKVVATRAYERDAARALERMLDIAGARSADALAAALTGAQDAIASFPLFHPSLGRAGYRWCPAGRYAILFRVDEAPSVVTLLRLVHMSTDWRARPWEWD